MERPTVNIPHYPILNPQIKPLDLSPISNTIDQWIQQKRFNAQQDRLTIQNAEQQVKNYDPGAIMGEQNKLAAAKEMQDFQDQITKAATYQKDEKGNFLQKLRQKIGTEPQFTDEEKVKIAEKGAELAQKYKQWNTWSKQASAIQKQFVSSKPGTYDPLAYQMYMGDYMASNNGTNLSKALQPASENPMDPKTLNEMDPRTADEKKPIQTLSKDGKTIIFTTPNADINQARLNYYARAKSDYGYQKGLVDTMMADQNTTEEQKIEFIKGILAGGAITNGDIAQRAEKDAKTMIYDYKYNHNYDPYLIEAATQYGDQVKEIPSMIGKGNERTQPNYGLVNAELRKTKDTILPQGTEVSYNGQDYKDFILIDKNISGYQPSKRVDVYTTTKQEGNYGKSTTTHSSAWGNAAGDYKLLGYSVDQNKIVLAPYITSTDNYGNKIKSVDYSKTIEESGNNIDALSISPQDKKLIKGYIDRSQNQNNKITIKWAN